MPNIPQRVTPRAVPRGPEGLGNVGLQVTQRIPPGYAGAGTFKVINQLQGLTMQMVKAHEARKEQERKQQFASGREAALADFVNGTGGDDAADGGSNAYQNGYHQSEGILAAKGFEAFATEKMATLEPDADINAKLHEWADEYMAKGPVSPVAQEAMLSGIARTQLVLRGKFQEQAHREIAARNVENAGAMAMQSWLDGSFSDPEGQGLKTFANYAANKLHLSGAQINDLLYNSATTALAQGKLDPEQAIKVLSQARADGTPGIYSIPKYRDGINQAVHQGKVVLERQKKEAQEGPLTDGLIRLQHRIDNGQATDAEIKEFREKFDLTPAWAASWSNRLAAARERAARAHTVQTTQIDPVAEAFRKGDPVALAMVGENALKKYVNGTIKKAYQAGVKLDDPRMVAFMGRAAQEGIEISFFNERFKQFDASRPEEAKKLLALRKTLRAATNERYVDSLIPADVQAQMDRYDSLTDYGQVSDDTALATIASTEPVTEGKLVSSALSSYSAYLSDQGANLVDADDGFMGFGATTATKNPGYVHRRLMSIMKELLVSGQYGTDWESAKDRAKSIFRSRHIIVDGRWLHSKGIAPDAAEAIQVYQADKVKKLKEAGKLTKNDDAHFIPDPVNPGKWTLVHGDGLGRTVVTTKQTVTNLQGQKVTREIPVTVSMSNVTKQYKAWKAEKGVKDNALRSALATNFDLHGDYYGDPVEHPGAAEFGLKDDLTMNTVDKLVTGSPGYRSRWMKSQRKRFKGNKREEKRLDSIQNILDNESPDFFEYLSNHKG